MPGTAEAAPQHRADIRTAALAPRSRRWLPWLGTVFIAVMGLHAAHDIHRHRAEVVATTERDLEAQARVIAEQTARSIQAIDLVLGHLTQALGGGRVDSIGRDALHEQLEAEARGMVQVEGLAFFDAAGAIRAASAMPVAQLPNASFAGAGAPPGLAVVGDTFDRRLRRARRACCRYRAALARRAKRDTRGLLCWRADAAARRRLRGRPAG